MMPDYQTFCITGKIPAQLQNGNNFGNLMCAINLVSEKQRWLQTSTDKQTLS